MCEIDDSDYQRMREAWEKRNPDKWPDPSMILDDMIACYANSGGKAEPRLSSEDDLYEPSAEDVHLEKMSEGHWYLGMKAPIGLWQMSLRSDSEIGLFVYTDPRK